MIPWRPPKVWPQTRYPVVPAYTRPSFGYYETTWHVMCLPGTSPMTRTPTPPMPPAQLPPTQRPASVAPGTRPGSGTSPTDSGPPRAVPPCHRGPLRPKTKGRRRPLCRLPMCRKRVRVISRTSPQRGRRWRSPMNSAPEQASVKNRPASPKCSCVRSESEQAGAIGPAQSALSAVRPRKLCSTW